MIKAAFATIATAVSVASSAAIPPHLNVPWSMPATIHWGETVEQIAAANAITAGQNPALNVEGLIYGARSRYELWGVLSDLDFFFSPLRRGLSMIRVKPIDQNTCSAFRTEVRTLTPGVIPLCTSPLSESETYYRSLNNSSIEFLTIYNASGLVSGCAILIRATAT